MKAWLAANWLAFAGGIITGTAIGNFKTALDIWDRFRRPKIAIDRTLNGRGGNRPNEIIVTNLSSSPVLLNYWRLVWREPLWKVWTWNDRDTLVDDSEDSPALRLDPMIPKTFLFGGENWFDWGASVARGRSLIFRHVLVGEKRLRDVKLA